MINMTPGLDKGQFGQSMHQFEAITTSDLTQPADLWLLWRPPWAGNDTYPLHDSILKAFITLLGDFKNSKQLQDVTVAVNLQKTHFCEFLALIIICNRLLPHLFWGFWPYKTNPLASTLEHGFSLSSDGKVAKKSVGGFLSSPTLRFMSNMITTDLYWRGNICADSVLIKLQSYQ